MTTIFDFALALERIDACHIDIDMEIFRKFFVDWARSGFSKDGAIKLENMIKRIDQEIENNMLKELDLRLKKHDSISK